MATTQLPAELSQRIQTVFGANTDPMPQLEERARKLLADQQAIVWEADAATFAFHYVSASAERVLGYPLSRWTSEPTFWADVVVISEDRDDSVSFCVAETGQCRDHAFDYRARAADGHVVRLHDVVRVLRGGDGKASRLRGIMVALTPSATGG
jgi:PAS domain-containing protein